MHLRLLRCSWFLHGSVWKTRDKLESWLYCKELKRAKSKPTRSKTRVYMIFLSPSATELPLKLLPNLTDTPCTYVICFSMRPYQYLLCLSSPWSQRERCILCQKHLTYFRFPAFCARMNIQFIVSRFTCTISACNPLATCYAWNILQRPMIPRLLFRFLERLIPNRSPLDPP